MKTLSLSNAVEARLKASKRHGIEFWIVGLYELGVLTNYSSQMSELGCIQWVYSQIRRRNLEVLK